MRNEELAIISKAKYNDHEEEQQEVSEEENYLGDHQYAQERFTDRYNEYFEDDENKSDRYTNTNHKIPS